MPGPANLSFGNVAFTFLIAPKLIPSAVAEETTAEQSFTVPGLLVGDFVDVNSPSITAGLGIVNARVSAANTIVIAFANTTSGSLTPPSGLYQIQVNRPSTTPVPTLIE